MNTTATRHEKVCMRLAVALLTGVLSMLAAAADNQPAHGSLGRSIFGDDFGNDTATRIGGWIEGGYVWNNHRSGNEGLGNSPIVLARDTGIQLHQAYLYFERDIRTNVIPRATPIPAPVFQQYAFGWYVNVLYGRDGQPVQTFGFDSLWGVNKPGNEDPARAQADRQSFLVMPQVFVQGYLPWHKGMSFILGNWMSPVGYEVGFPFEPGPNLLYSRNYAFESNPIKHTGLLWAANIVKEDRHLLSAELGIVRGWSNFKDNNDKLAYMLNLRYRTNGMDTWVDFEMITGDSQIDPGKAGFPPGPDQGVDFADRANIPVSRVISPNRLNKTQISINGSHQFDENWKGVFELTYGRHKGDGSPATIDIITGPGFNGAKWSGIAAQVQYIISPTLYAAGRIEQFRDRDGFILFPNTVAVRSNYNEITLGLSWRPNKHFLMQPEIRYDWQTGNNGAKAFASGTQSRQLTISTNAIFYF